MGFIHGKDKIIALVFMLGMFCWFAYSDGCFDGILNENKESDEEEQLIFCGKLIK